MKYTVKLSTKVRAEKLAKVSKGTAILAIEPEDYSDTEIKAIKARGYTLLAYLSIGTISKERNWYGKYKQYKLKRLPDWPKEYYMDMRYPQWTAFLVSRSKALKQRGFDGWWLDNLDVYEEYPSASMFNACHSVLRSIKALGGYVMVNGGSEFWDVAMDKKVAVAKLVSGVTQEEVFSRITRYSGKGKFGKQTSLQSKFYRQLLKRLWKNKVQTFLLEYTRDAAIKAKVKAFCIRCRMTGYCISSDVDL